MALRDLFDSDTRSKQQLRDELDVLTLRLKTTMEVMATRGVDDDELKSLLTVREGEISRLKEELRAAFEELSASQDESASLRVHVANQASSIANLTVDVELTNRKHVDAERELASRKLTSALKSFAMAKALNQQVKLQSSFETLASDMKLLRQREAKSEDERDQLQLSVDKLNAELAALRQRETTIADNFAELKKREALLSQNIVQFAAREKNVAGDIKSELLAKSREVDILRADLRETSKELREAKFVYESMFGPYKGIAAKLGGTAIEIQVADLQSKLFSALEEMAEMRENGAPDLQAARQELDELRRQIARSNDDIKSHASSIRSMQRKLDDSAVREALAKDREAEADRRTELARNLTKSEVARLNKEHAAQIMALQEKEPELDGLKRTLRATQEKLVTLEAFNQTLMREKGQHRFAVHEYRRPNPVVGISTEKKNSFPDKWRNSIVLSWMLETSNPEDCEVDFGYLTLVGSGPWQRDVFGGVLESRGFSLWSVPDAEVMHMVVGVDDWTRDELESQIDAVTDGTLRIYSQEMWFAFLATGRDPFDSGNEDLLLAFAEDHPALQYLIQRDIPWPSVSLPKGGGVVAPSLSDFGVLESPMHMLDYRVGATSQNDAVSRREILRACFNAVRLPFGDDCSREYRTAWGSCRSPQRLYRMALHIKHQIEGPSGRDYRKPQACADWLSDLEWLKTTFFKKPLRTFDWPGSYL